MALIEGDRQRVLSLGRAAGSAAQIHQLVTREVVFTIPEGSRRTGLSEVTVAKAAAHLEGLGIVREVTGKPRNKLFAYGSYLALLQEGTEQGT